MYKSIPYSKRLSSPKWQQQRGWKTLLKWQLLYIDEKNIKDEDKREKRIRSQVRVRHQGKCVKEALNFHPSQYSDEGNGRWCIHTPVYVNHWCVSFLVSGTKWSTPTSKRWRSLLWLTEIPVLHGWEDPGRSCMVEGPGQKKSAYFMVDRKQKAWREEPGRKHPSMPHRPYPSFLTRIQLIIASQQYPSPHILMPFQEALPIRA